MFIKRLILAGTLALAGIVALATGQAAFADDTQKFIISVDNVGQFAHKSTAVFNTPVGQGAPGPLLPGGSYQATVYGDPGDYVSFATMFVQSNDWFFAPDELGIPLYNADGTPVSGDVTQYVKLWDAGTEVDQPVGEGVDQAPRQVGPNTGAADPNNYVRRVFPSTEISAADQLVRVTLTPHGSGRFTLNVQNISASSISPSPLAPGVAVVHNTPAPLFVNGKADLGIGLEALAEDGSVSQIAGYVAARTGINTPIAPVAWTVHNDANALFARGQRASAGLEALAEDGGPGGLVAELDQANKGAAAVGRGASAAGPIFAPAGNYSFEVTASRGQHISLAAMFVQSNDWFYGVNSLPLFDTNGNPISGNITQHVTLYDAGTEVDQTPGFGSNQAPRQAGPNTGATQGGVITAVTGQPAVGNNIHITVTPVD